MLIELLISMTFLAVAIGALISIYASGVLSLRHSSIEGNALTLVEKQMEVFKTLPYASLQLNSATIPAGSDPYVSSPPSNLTSGQQAGISGGQVTGGTYSATQNVTGPDNRSYRVDTYMFTGTPPSGRNVIQVTVSARLITSGTPGAIRAQSTSAFDLASTRLPPN
jgi:hypothetical protein